MLAGDLAFLPAETVEVLLRDCDTIARLINGLLRSLKTKGTDETPTR